MPYPPEFEDAGFSHYRCKLCGKLLKRIELPHRKSYWGFGRTGARNGLRTAMFNRHLKACPVYTGRRKRFAELQQIILTRGVTPEVTAEYQTLLDKMARAVPDVSTTHPSGG